MGDEAAKFFTAACGVESRLVWTGMEGKREVLGTMSQGKDR